MDETYRFGHDVEQARASLSLVHVALTNEVLLRMAGHLRWRPCLDKVARDTSPVTLSQFLQSKQKEPMLILRPWYTCNKSNLLLTIMEYYSTIRENTMYHGCKNENRKHHRLHVLQTEKLSVPTCCQASIFNVHYKFKIRSA